MMKRGEKISRPSASILLKPKQMQNSRLGPRSFEPNVSEHEAPESREAPNFRYNLLNIPIYPLIQCNESEEEELLQFRMDKAVQQQPEDKGVLQGRFLPVQPKATHFSYNYNLLNIPEYTPVQKQAEMKPNLTGIPDQLKAGIESLSGIDISDVRVHANSNMPARLNALAYAQGNQIHLGSGQERHLPHEVWHVVQQKQGRIQSTTSMNGLDINDDPVLEREADGMGAKAAQKAKVFLDNTRRPENFEAGIENPSMMSMNGVKVHCNSGKPPQLNALAFAQGKDNHAVSGQERHLPHEAWHVVQQQAARQSLSSVTSPIQLMVEFAADRTVANADFKGIGVRRMGANHTTAHGLYEAIAERAVAGKSFEAAIEALRNLITNLTGYQGYLDMQPGDKILFCNILQSYLNDIPAPATVLECNWAATIEKAAGHYIYLRGVLLYTMHDLGDGGVTQNGEGAALVKIRKLLSTGYNSDIAPTDKLDEMVYAVLSLFDFRSWGLQPGPVDVDTQIRTKFLPAILQHLQSIRDLSPQILNPRFGVRLSEVLNEIPSMKPMTPYLRDDLLWRLGLV